MIDIKIVGDRELAIEMDKISRNIPTALKRIVNIAALWVKREAMLNLSGRMLHVRTNKLRSSLAIVFGGTREAPNAIIRPNAFYAPVLHDGMTIRARNVPYLRFKVGGSWVRVKQVIIPPRPFMTEALKSALPYIKISAEEEISRLIK